MASILLVAQEGLPCWPSGRRFESRSKQTRASDGFEELNFGWNMQIGWATGNDGDAEEAEMEKW